MKGKSIKIFSVLVILMFCLSPLSAIDLNQGDEATHSNIGNDTNLNDVNNTIDIIDVDKDKTVNDTSIEVDKGNKDIKKDSSSENRSLNDTHSNQKLKSNPRAHMKVDDVTYGQRPVIKVWYDNWWVNYLPFNITIKGLNYYKYYENIRFYYNSGEMKLDEMPAGTYEITMVYGEDYYFVPVTLRDYFTVREANPDFDVHIDDVAEDQKPIAKITCNSNIEDDLSFVPILCNGSGFNFPLKKGTFEYVMDDDFEPGTYTYSAIYGGNGNYSSKVVTRSFTVNGRYRPNLSVCVDDVSVGESATAKVSAVDSFNGTVDMILDNTSVGTVDVKNGHASFKLGDKLSSGKHNVTVKFNGSDKYKNAESSTTFNIKLNPSLSISVDDVSVGESATAKVSAVDSFNGRLHVILDNTDVGVVDVKNGHVNFILGFNMSVGEHNAIVKFDGNDQYNKAESSTTFNVTKLDPNLSISVADVHVGENAIAKINANESFNGTVDIILGNTNVGSADVKDGHASFDLGNQLSVGKYNATVKFDGNEKYDKSESSTTFNINKRDLKLSISVADAFLET